MLCDELWMLQVSWKAVWQSETVCRRKQTKSMCRIIPKSVLVVLADILVWVLTALWFKLFMVINYYAYLLKVRRLCSICNVECWAHCWVIMHTSKIGVFLTKVTALLKVIHVLVYMIHLPVSLSLSRSLFNSLIYLFRKTAINGELYRLKMFSIFI